MRCRHGVQSGSKTPGLVASFWLCLAAKATESTGFWRRRVEVESTIRPAKDRIAGFEGRESHRTLFASGNSIAWECRLTTSDWWKGTIHWRSGIYLSPTKL